MANKKPIQDDDRRSSSQKANAGTKSGQEQKPESGKRGEQNKAAAQKKR